MKKIICVIALLTLLCASCEETVVRLTFAGDCTLVGNVLDSGYDSFKKLFDEHDI